MSKRGARPWRAVAYLPDKYGGRRRQLVGYANAKTQDGLTRFVLRHRQAGHETDVWRVQLLDVDGAR